MDGMPSDYDHQPGHLARRFQQIAVAVFHAEAQKAGYDLTPVQYVALVTIEARPGLDQATLAGLIAHDRTTITGVVDRLVHKRLITRRLSGTDRRARMLSVTEDGRAMLRGLGPAVERAQQALLRGLSAEEAADFMRLLRKAIAAGNDLSRAPLLEATPPAKSAGSRGNLRGGSRD